MGFLSSEPSAVERKIEELIGASPETLDTLNELAAALGDDENFATTVTNEIATKAPIESPTFTGTVGGVTKAMVGLDQVDNTSDLNKPISTATQTALDAEATTRADADTALDDRLDTVETTLPTKADLVGGVVPTAQMPAISIMERVSVADEAARLALTSPGQVQVGDVAVQADTGVTWLLIDVDPSLAASWKAIDQSDAVQSVNGQTGTVVLAKADIGLGNVDNTADLDKPISTATQTALDTKADDSTVVKLTGDQTVAGVKTFSSPPVVPTPTGATEAASKGYVDTAIANGTSAHGVRVTTGAVQSVASATFTAVWFPIETWDTANFHDTATNNSRITIPAGKAGRYSVAGSVVFASNTTGRRFVELRKNGSTTPLYRFEMNGSASGGTVCLPVTEHVTAAAGDYFELFVYQSSGVALNLDQASSGLWSTFGMEYLGPVPS